MKSVWNTYFFSRPITASALFVLHCTYNGDNTRRVWFDLDNSKTQSITTTFKIRFSRNSQTFVWKRNFFFRRQALAKVSFDLQSTLTWNTLFRVCFNLNNLLTQSKKKLYLKFANREIRNFPYENPTFFVRQATPKILFVLHYNYTGHTPFRVWFGLDSSLTRSNRPIFKISYSRNSQSSVWNPYEILTFLIGQL